MVEVRQVAIAGTGAYLPERILANDDLARLVDTSDEWIQTRTGIRERRIADEGAATSDLAIPAVRQALEQAHVTPESVDLIIVATITPDHVFPSTACHIQAAIGAENAWGFDLSAACAGFLFALNTGRQFIESGQANTVVVVGAECLSRITDYQDRNTCILFGDGAGAVVLRPSDGRSGALLEAINGIDGSGGEVMKVPAGGSRMPASYESVETRQHFMRVRGREVYRFAVGKMVDLVREVADRAGIEVSQIARIIPHQVNLRILESARTRLELPEGVIVSNIDRYGNTSAASIPIALHEAVEGGLVKPGDHLVFVAFGAGLSWGAVAARW